MSVDLPGPPRDGEGLVEGLCVDASGVAGTRWTPWTTAHPLDPPLDISGLAAAAAAAAIKVPRIPVNKM